MKEKDDENKVQGDDKEGLEVAVDEGGQTGTEEEIDIDLDDPEVGNAALKIQSGFRGHQARKEVQAMKDKDIENKIHGENVEGQDKAEDNDGQEGVKDEIDIDLDDPEVGNAALKIQSGFRGHQARKEVQAMKEKDTERETEGQGGDHPEEEEIDIDLDDPEVGNAALKIQSGFRGHQARKEVQAMREGQESKGATEDEQEDIDIDLEDPEVGKAAVKIQSSFRGHQARKEVNEMRENEKEEQKPTSGDDQDAPSTDDQKVSSDGTHTAKNKDDTEDDIDIDLEDPEVGKAALKIQSSFRGHQVRKDMKANKSSDELTAAEDVDSGTSMSSKSSVTVKGVTPVPVKGDIIKVESVEKPSQADSGSEMVTKTSEEDEEDMMDESVSEEDSSRTGPIKSKRPAFSLIRLFVNKMNPLSRKHRVGVQGSTKMSKAKSMHNVSTDRSDASSKGSQSNSSKKLTKRLSKSRNSVASESVSSSRSEVRPRKTAVS